MVKQEEQTKTSSKKVRSEYRFPTYLLCGQCLPLTLETKVQADLTGKPGYILSGKLHTECCDEDEWQVLPHIALANLLVDNPKSAEAFIRRYGVLRHNGVAYEFAVDSSELRAARDELRAAWGGDSVCVVEMESRVVENTAVDVLIDTSGDVLLRTQNLLTFISFLFLRDYTAGKLGICENPDCPAPYFRKKRKTQKFCEAGPCVVYAQRQYSLAWWNREGKKRRKKKQPNRPH